MPARSLPRFLFVMGVAFLLFGCGISEAIIGETVTVTILYGSEKQGWLEPLVEEYNAAAHETADGAKIVIEAQAIGSIESVEAILSGTAQPTVWSPASSIYIPVANAEWRKTHNTDLVDGKPNDLVLSPVVIAMWQPMAEALGWPDKAIGWSDIFALATSEEGWSAYGYPEWGSFKFGHTHPDYSNSGVASVLAIAYAGAGKQRDLDFDDLQSLEVANFMEAVEKSVIHYGRSTGFFAEQMFGRGPSYLSAAVLYENLVVEQEVKRLSGQSSQLPVVAIYPKEGTFWTNHPYAILNAPWVTVEQRAAAEDFETFLLAQPQQQRAIALGFRPADPVIALASPLDAQHGVDPAQPQTVLEIPDAEIIEGALEVWQENKKPVDLVVVMDISGSMAGDKISAARQSLVQFIDLLDSGDRLEIVLFSTDVTALAPLTPLSDIREEMKRRVSGVIEGGDTSLYDAVAAGYADLLADGDPQHIRAMVVLSDGQDTASTLALEQLMVQLGSQVGEGGNAPKLFTIAFGSDADTDILKQIAEATGGRQFSGDPSNINSIYAEIATFF